MPPPARPDRAVQNAERTDVANIPAAANRDGPVRRQRAVLEDQVAGDGQGEIANIHASLSLRFDPDSIFTAVFD